MTPGGAGAADTHIDRASNAMLVVKDLEECLPYRAEDVAGSRHCPRRSTKPTARDWKLPRKILD
jgi:hypothetical protein